jgi:hypothetical protein
MEEILPGVVHWTAFRETIGMEVSCYHLTATRTLVDPLLPEGGLEALPAAERVVLTNRLHLRHAEQIADAFGCPILCHEAGLDHFAGGPRVEGFAFGDELAPGLTAHRVDAICAEETALHIADGDGALALADGLIRYGEEPTFVPDELIGEEPEAVKRDLTEAFRALLELRFDSLLFAHGSPLVGGGHDALKAFVTAFDRS